MSYSIEAMTRRTACRLMAAAAVLIVGGFLGVYLRSLHCETGPFVRHHDIPISNCSFAPDLRFLPSGDSVLVDRAGWPTVYDVVSGRELRRFEQGNPLSLSPDGRLAAVDQTAPPPRGDSRVSVGILKFETGESVRTLRGPVWSAVSDLAWSPDGRWLARGNCQNSIDVWDLSQEVPVVNLRSDSHMDNMVERLLFTRDGHSLISAESYGGVRIRTAGSWTIQTQFQFSKHDGNDQMVTSIALSPDGTLMAACGGYSWSSSDQSMAHGVIKVWRVSDWSEVWTADLPVMVQKLGISPDNTFLVCSTWKEAQVWNLRTGGIIQKVGSCRGGAGMAFSSDGRWLAAANNSGMLTFWERLP